MRSLLLGFALLTAAVSPEAAAQEASGDRSDLEVAQSLGENALLTFGGLTAGMVSATLAAELIREAGITTEIGLPIGYSAGVTGFALGVHGTAQLLGIDGTLGNALGDAWTGGLIGLAAGGAMFALASTAPPCTNGVLCIDSGAFTAVLVGTSVAVLVPTVWVVSDYRAVAPTVMRSPDGTPAPGLSLTVGL